MRRLILWVSTVCLALSTVSSGEVKREIWNGAVSSPYMENAIARVNSGTPADQVDILDEPTWADIADNYVARMTGWLTVPETGEYTLYLSGDDYQRLWVSQDDNPGNAEVVAYVDGWTQSQEWGKYESQKAEPMMLTEGQVMAFVGIMEERGGGDGQDWGWIAPGSEEITVIPGELFVAEHEVTALGKAKMNAPAEGATGIIDAVLSWGLAVEDAEPPAYNLYFGTDPDALDLIGEGIVEESVDVGTAGAELEYATTYYWQVERIGAAVDPARSFTTEPFSFPIEGVAATTNGTSGPDVGTIEQTIDGSGLDENDGHSTESMDMWLAVPPEGEALTVEYAFDRVYKMDKMLIWNSNTGFESFLGYGVKDATIEYTLDGAEWMALADVEVARAPGLESNPADTTVDFGGVGAAAVRLTLKTNWGGLFPDTGLSEVRFMYIPGQARFPMPANGAEGVGPDAVLSWQTGRDAVSHDVLIGVDELALAGTVEDTSFAPELVYGMPYIWAVNENDGVDVWEGDLWSFSTTEFATVVGAQSLEYDNTAEPFLSEVETVLDPPVDLTAYGAQTLSVAYQVSPTNVALNGTATSSTTGYGWLPEFAIDGDLGTGSHSADNDPDKWLEVELDQVYSLEAIVVHNRASCCWERITGVIVKALDADRNEIYVSDPVAADDALQGSIHTYDNDGAGFADVRYIRLEGGTDFLQIMEIQALPSGYPVPVYLSVEDSAGQVATASAEATGAGQETMNVAIGALIDAGVDMTSVVNVAVGVGDPDNPVAGGSGTVAVGAVRVGTPMSYNVPADVTGPGDVVQGVPNDGLMDGDNFGWPGAETPDLAIDNDTGTKFLHFKGELEPTGIRVSCASGATIVTELTLTTANDAVERDPTSFELYGSNDGIDGPYTLIAAGDVVDFAGAEAWPRFTMNETPITFENDVAYSNYQLLFPTVRDAGSANSMQIGEVELIGVSSW